MIHRTTPNLPIQFVYLRRPLFFKILYSHLLSMLIRVGGEEVPATEKVELNQLEGIKIKQLSLICMRRACVPRDSRNLLQKVSRNYSKHN